MVISYYSPGETQSFTDSKFTSDYDNRGNLVKRIGYDSKGSPALQWAYTYDSKNRVVASDWGRGNQTVSWTYDNAGHAKASKVFDKGDLQGSHTFVLNPQGKVVEDNFYDANGGLSEIHKFKYDSTGNMVEYSEIKPDGSLISKKAHTFNSTGDATQTVVYGSDGRVASKTIYKYGEGRHLMEETEYSADGSLKSRHTKKRDAGGFVTEDVESNGSGQTVTVTKSEYEFYP